MRASKKQAGLSGASFPLAILVQQYCISRNEGKPPWLTTLYGEGSCCNGSYNRTCRNRPCTFHLHFRLYRTRKRGVEMFGVLQAGTHASVMAMNSFDHAVMLSGVCMCCCWCMDMYDRTGAVTGHVVAMMCFCWMGVLAA